jgi:3-hydroxyacyl-CoA dehydrogenase
LQALTKRVGKTGVVVGNCDGFCGNRLLRPYSAEMVMLLAEGVSSITAVDHAIHDDFGMALGPFAMADLAGNDVGYNIRKERGWVRSSAGAPRPPQQPARYTELADVMVSQHGRMGQKAGKGWHNYDPSIGKGRTPLPSPEMDALVAAYTTKAEEGVRRSSSPTQLTPNQIIERVLYPLVNEGFKCLEEGIVQRPSDIDVVYVYGYGWPVWRGGPMHWADHDVGLPRLLTTLQRLHRQFPETEHYEPSRLLEDCVRQGVTVEDYWKQQEQRSKL